jgi:hypothetical protein
MAGGKGRGERWGGFEFFKKQLDRESKKKKKSKLTSKKNFM